MRSSLSKGKMTEDGKLRKAESADVCYIFNVGEACACSWAMRKESPERERLTITEVAKPRVSLGGRQVKMDELKMD